MGFLLRATVLEGFSIVTLDLELRSLGLELRLSFDFDGDCCRIDSLEADVLRLLCI